MIDWLTAVQHIGTKEFAELHLKLVSLYRKMKCWCKTEEETADVLSCYFSYVFVREPADNVKGPKLWQ